VYQGFALAVPTIVSSGQSAGCDEELRQAACRLSAPGGVNRWFKPWVIRPVFRTRWSSAMLLNFILSVLERRGFSEKELDSIKRTNHA